MDCGSAEIQTAWRPLMSDQGWGIDRLRGGSLDDPESLRQWSFGKRMTSRVESEVTFANRSTYQGAGALRARVTSLADDALPGGYEGTAIQIRSPSVRVPAGTPIRIDVMVRTIGFGRPHQGVLVYDTVGGQEMGVLIRGRANWTPVRLYRQSMAEGEINVMFELIGAGEATIDEVQMRIWEPQDTQPLPLRRSRSDPMNRATRSRQGDDAAVIMEPLENKRLSRDALFLAAALRNPSTHAAPQCNKSRSSRALIPTSRKWNGRSTAGCANRGPGFCRSLETSPAKTILAVG